MANYSNGYFLVNYGIQLSINITPSAATPTWAVLGDGINNIAEALNEVKQDMYYLINKGFGQTEVTAMHPTYSVSGNRIKGDAAQDFIFSKKYGMGPSRKTQMMVKVMNTDNNSIIYDSYMCDITFCDLQEFSGATENGSDITITLSLNGSPEMLVASPEFAVIGEHTASVSIQISCATAGTTIYYTTDGTEPTTSSSQYTAVITDTTVGTKTYKAIAVKSGYANSIVSSRSVTVGS